MIDRREWQSAKTEALALVRDAPNRARSYNLLNVASCLSTPNAAIELSPGLIDRARECDDQTDELIGDMMRDRVIALIRTRAIYSYGLVIAGEVIEEIKHLHAGNKNRLACIIGVEARLFFALGQYRKAVEAHAEADRIWRSLGLEAYPQWVYNNYVHWLRATIAADGRYVRMVRQLTWLINTRCPEGAKKRVDEAAVMLLPFVGLRLYEWYTSRH
jgi:hypothetical protein